MDEINAILDKETTEFNRSYKETNALDNIAREYVDSPTLEIGVPKNISEAMWMPKAIVVAQRIKRRIYKRKMKLFIDSLCSCSPTNRGDVTDFSVTENFQVSFSE